MKFRFTKTIEIDSKEIKKIIEEEGKDNFEGLSSREIDSLIREAVKTICDMAICSTFTSDPMEIKVFDLLMNQFK